MALGSKLVALVLNADSATQDAMLFTLAVQAVPAVDCPQGPSVGMALNVP